MNALLHAVAAYCGSEACSSIIKVRSGIAAPFATPVQTEM